AAHAPLPGCDRRPRRLPLPRRLELAREPRARMRRLQPPPRRPGRRRVARALRRARPPGRRRRRRRRPAPRAARCTPPRRPPLARSRLVDAPTADRDPPRRAGREQLVGIDLAEPAEKV